MNKTEFLSKLEKELKKRNVANIDEVMDDYDQHFRHKFAEGYGEEEICAKLGSAEDIASQYVAKPAVQDDKFKKVCTVTGLVFLDILAASAYALLCATVIAIGGFALASLATGACLITDLNIADLIPPMPYLSSLVLGISALALALFSSTGAIYGYLIAKQCAKKYFRWHNNMCNDTKRPPLPLMPQLQKKPRRILSRLCMLSFIAFAVTFVCALFVLFAQADFNPFWHEWNWFQD